MTTETTLTGGVSAHRVNDGESEDDWFPAGTAVTNVAESHDFPDFWNVEFDHGGERWVAGFEGGSGLWAFGLPIEARV